MGVQLNDDVASSKHCAPEIVTLGIVLSIRGLDRGY